MRVAINGFGRIGRCILRAIIEKNYKDIDIVAINAGSATTELDLHLFKYDSIHGKSNIDVKIINPYELNVGSKLIKITHEKDISKLDWTGIDCIFECTGKFLTYEKAIQHIKQGATKVLLSAPAKDQNIPTVVHKVNDSDIDYSAHEIFSVGSCTTNCLAPVARVINDNFGIQSGFVTTVHAYTNDQNIIDGSHKSDFRRARSAAVSMIPTGTGAAKAIANVIPSLAGKLDGSAVRVPVQNVSMIDFVCTVANSANVNSVNEAFRVAAFNQMSGVLGYCNEPLVSIDFNHTDESAIFDSLETRCVGEKLLRVVAWYDNEWSFALRMLDIARKICI